MKQWILLAAAACSTILAAAPARAVPFLPDFALATFVPGAAVDNPYFPLVPGAHRVYRNDDEGERFETLILKQRVTVAGIDAVVLRDRAFEDGKKVEDTFDYFAQDTDGNVWYLGEDVTNFIYDVNGDLIGTTTAGAWHAGVNGALPGFQMPVSLALGFNYFQEHAPADAAIDDATTFAILPQLDLDIGSFFDVLQVFETTQLDPTSREFKYYAPGFGLILVDEELDPNNVPAFSIPLVHTGVVLPEPALVAPFLIGLGTMLVLGARRRDWAAEAHSGLGLGHRPGRALHGT